MLEKKEGYRRRKVFLCWLQEGCNFILCQLFMCWVHNVVVCVNLQTDIAEYCMQRCRHEDRISPEELGTRVKLMECLQNWRVQWFGHLEIMEENSWSTECWTFKGSGSFPREWLRKHGMR